MSLAALHRKEAYLGHDRQSWVWEANGGEMQAVAIIGHLRGDLLSQAQIGGQATLDGRLNPGGARNHDRDPGVS
jgi:hypothetical protein